MSILQIHNISLNYDSISALKEVSFSLEKGEIHAVVGEHGAGKSSLAHIIAGFQTPGMGTIIWNAKRVENHNHQSALSKGIRMVSQNNPLHDNLSVAENLLLNHRAGLFPILTRKRILKEAGRYLAETGFNLDPSQPLTNLRLADRALVDILRHLYHHPKLLILDETLEKLSSENLRQILKILNKKTRDGLTVLFISHRVDDIYNIADRVTIIRDGCVYLTEKIDHIDKMTLIRLAYTHALRDRDIRSKESFNQIIRFNEAILKDLPVALFVIDQDGIIRMQNKNARNLTGKRSVGKSVLKLFSDSTSVFSKCVNPQKIPVKAKTHYQIPLSIKGQIKIFNISTCPVNERSTSLGYLLILIDVTEQERLREQVTLSENLASIGLLAAGVAHEINNPLDIMGYYLENLRFSGLTDQQIQTLKGIEEEIESVSQIVGNLISFSDKNPREEQTFDLQKLTKNLTELLSFKAEEIGIHFSSYTPDEPVMVDGNPNEIKQVLLNLARNAFDAMKNGGDLKISLSCKQDQAILEFQDSGPGIPEEILKEIFLPFFSTRPETGQNMGLGLSISYGLIQKNKGILSLENIKKGGCTARVSLPCRTEPQNSTSQNLEVHTKSVKT